MVLLGIYLFPKRWLRLCLIEALPLPTSTKYGNGEQRKAALGNQYQAVMDRINGKTTTNQKTDEELAKEVIAGKHGNGEERKASLGSRYDAVQK